MSEPTILFTFPIILTKDTTWKPNTPAVEGAIFVLPEDAVLVVPPTTELKEIQGSASQLHKEDKK